MEVEAQGVEDVAFEGEDAGCEGRVGGGTEVV